MSIQPAWTRSLPANGSITREQFADPAGMPTVRRAAKFGAGSASAVLVPTTNAATVRFKARLGNMPNSSWAFGRDQSGYIAFGRDFIGRIRLSIGNAVSIDAPDGVFSDTDIQVEIAVASNTYTLKINGVTVASGAQTTPLVTTGTNTSWIGKAQITPSVQFTGTIWDVEFIDPASPANSAFFPLDGDFQNTAAGSSVADATPSGLITWPTVLSTGESERAVLAAYPVLVTAERGSAISAGSVLSFGGGGLNTNNGIVLTHAAELSGLSFRSISGVTGTATVAVRRNGTNVATVAATSAAQANSATVSGSFAAGDRVDFIVTDFTSGFGGGITASALLLLNL